MKHIERIAAILLLAAAGFGQTPPPVLAGSCQHGGDYPNCVGGEVVFTSSSYAGQVHVKVVNSAGEVIDNGDYSTTNGTLRFVENLSFAGTYTISINGQAVLTVTTQ